MRILSLLLLVLILPGCDKNDPGDPHFDSRDLFKLHLEDMESFWHGDTIESTSDVMFEDYPGFLDGIIYRGNSKGMGISVFESQESALLAIDSMRNNIVCIIEDGTSNRVEEIWWFSECLPNIVLANKWNTIVEVYSGANAFESHQDVLFEAANEIISRVEDLGE